MSDTALLNPSNTPIVDIVDDHDEAYPLWKEADIQNQILVHIDEHSDFQWITDKNPTDLLKASSAGEMLNLLKESKGWTTESLTNRGVHIGNFLHRVFEEKMAREWHWVVPSPLWDHPKFRETLWKEVMSLYRLRTGEMKKPKKTARGFETEIMGVKTYVSSISELPSFDEPVLLSLDVDYSTSEPLDKPAAPEIDRKRVPWIWPEDLIGLLNYKGIKFSRVAIANSVNGGFTPVQFKFLGECYSSLLTENKLPEHYPALKQAINLRNQNKDTEAYRIITSFKTTGSLEAARLYQEAQLSYDQGSFEKASACFKETAQIDAEFFSKYNSTAPVYEIFNMHEEARDEYKRMRILTPNLIEPLIGEARYLATKKSPWQAIQKFEALLTEHPNNFQLLFSVGTLYLFKAKDYPKAIEALLKAIASNKSEPNAYTCLGIAYLKDKNYVQAKYFLREALRWGSHTPITYHYLARVYFVTRKWYKAWECTLESIRLFLIETWDKMVNQ